MKAALTDIFLRSLKPPATGRLEIADIKCAGLEFRLTAGGVRSWSFRFRNPATGLPARSTIGRYPQFSLAEARQAVNALRKQVAHGVNPVRAKREERAEAESRTFRALAERYLDEHARRKNRPRTVDVGERTLRLHILPAWGDRPYDQITRRDCIELAETLVAAGKPSLANRTQALISSIYSYAIDADLVTANPCSRLRKRGVETHKTRVLSDDEIRLLWSRSVMPPVSRSVGLALRLCLLTGMRAGEVAGLALAEIEYLDDPERAAVIIPSERTKNGKAHYVPLAPLAVKTVRDALVISEENRNGQVFAPRGEAIQGHVLAVAMRRLASRLPYEPGADTWRVDPPSPHDLRRTCATRLASLGAPGEDVSAILNHVRQDVTGRYYDQYARAKEKRAALATWANALGAILHPGDLRQN